MQPLLKNVQAGFKYWKYGTQFPFFCFNAIFMHAPRKMQWHYFKNAGCPHRGVMKKLNPLSAAALMYSGFKNFCMTKIIWLLSRCIFFGIFLSRALSFLIFANGSIFITHQLSYTHKKSRTHSAVIMMC